MALIFDPEKKEIKDIDMGSIITTQEKDGLSKAVSDLDKLNSLMDKVNTLLSNPVIHQLFNKIFNKQQEQVIIQNNEDKARRMYNALMFMLNSLDKNMTIEQLSNELKKNENAIIQKLREVV